jgi:predicted dehydrogenase
MTKERLGVSIIGCGLIGQKRTKAQPTSLGRAQALARSAGGTALTDWRMVTANPAIDVVIIAIPHDTLAEITVAAVKAGKHVLVENPAARFASKLIPVLAARDKKRVHVHVGLNHRCHRSLHKAKELVSSEFSAS